MEHKLSASEKFYIGIFSFISLIQILIKVHGYYICDALRDLVPFVQFKKHEKHL